MKYYKERGNHFPCHLASFGCGDSKGADPGTRVKEDGGGGHQPDQPFVLRPQPGVPINLKSKILAV